METLNNAASAASRALWGDSTTKNTTTNTAEEPISGKAGDTAAGEPYDAGNLGTYWKPRSSKIPQSQKTNNRTDSTNTGKTTTGPHESNIGNKVDPTGM